MATIHLAIDEVTGLTLPFGQIKGLSDSLQGLRDAGFGADPYTGNRITTADDAAAGWDDDVTVGWYLTAANTVAAYVPPTELQDLQDAIRGFQAQVRVWYAAVNELGVGQPAERVTDGRRRLYEALGAVYVYCTNTGNSQTNRKLFATNMTFGALGITKADDFYAADVPILTGDEPERMTGPNMPSTAPSWHCWVNPTNPGGERLPLTATENNTVQGQIPASVNLLGDYAADISS